MASPPHNGIPAPPFKKKSVMPTKIAFFNTEPLLVLTLIIAKTTSGKAETIENFDISAMIHP